MQYIRNTEDFAFLLYEFLWEVPEPNAGQPWIPLTGLCCDAAWEEVKDRQRKAELGCVDWMALKFW